MIKNARRWRILAGGVAAGMAGVLGLAGNTAAADPFFPVPPQPAPAPVTQSTTAMPGAAAASQSYGQAGVAPALPAAQSATAPGLIPAAAPETLQATALQTFSAEPTAGNVIRAWEIHPQAGVNYPLALLDEINVAGGKRIGLRATAPQAQAVTAYIRYEE